ncbi:MAG: alkaline phosphatase family protein, partial [Planctomycetes bacterium]|nr:alkaline phosphatase family protein [Planctomycetota bacterium]
MSRTPYARGGAAPRRVRLRGLWLAVGVLALVGGGDLAAQGGSSAPGGCERVIVVGFDGADPGLLAQFLEAGELPAFAELRERGSFLELATSTPAESPVSWSSILTGLNPGRTGVFGFVQLSPDDDRSLVYTVTRWKEHRLPSTGDRLFMALGAGLILGLLIWAVGRMVRLRTAVAVLGAVAVGGLLAASAGLVLFTAVPGSLPATAPFRDGVPFYRVVAEHGLGAVALQAPMDAPPGAAPGLRVLSGLGIPDIIGQDASWAVYTSEILPASRTPSGGRIVLLESTAGRNDVDIHGPTDPFVSEALDRLAAREPRDFEEHQRWQAEMARRTLQLASRVRMGILWKPGEGRVVLELPGVAPVPLREGEWSDFLPLTFRSGKLVTRHGLVRFHVVRAGTELRLYQEPIGWDPR